MKAGWRQVRLDEIASISAGNSAPQAEALFRDGTHPFFRTSDVGKVHVGTLEDSEDKLNEKGIKGLRLYSAGTILVPKSGASTFLDHRVIMGRDGYVSSHLATVQPKARSVDPRFLFYALLTVEARSIAPDASYPTLSLADISAIRIPLPDLETQRRIVAILDEAFAAITIATANAEKSRAQVLELFIAERNKELLGARVGWKCKRLEEICCFSSGGTPSTANRSYWTGHIPWVSGKDMKSDRLSDAELHISDAALADSATRLASKGSLLILIRGMGLAHGVAVAELLSPCAFNQDIKAIHPSEEIHPRFLLILLQAVLANGAVLSRAAHGTLKVEMDALRATLVHFPAKGLQRAIADRLDKIAQSSAALAELYQRKIKTLADLRLALLKAIFTGGLSPGAEIKVAAE